MRCDNGLGAVTVSGTKNNEHEKMFILDEVLL